MYVKTIIIITGFFLLIQNVECTAQSQSTRTEEYAIVDVVDRGKKKLIRVTVNEKGRQEKKWEKEKTASKDDFGPVLRVLGDLNEKGFEILNISTTYSTELSHSGNPHYTIMMVRKIK